MVGVTAHLGPLLGLLHPVFRLPRDSRNSVVRYTSSAGSVHPDPLQIQADVWPCATVL